MLICKSHTIERVSEGFGGIWRCGQKYSMRCSLRDAVLLLLATQRACSQVIEY